MRTRETLQVDFHSDMTVADQDAMSALPGEAFPPSASRVKKDRRLTRRTFIALGGIVLGASGLGAGYAASHVATRRSMATRGPATTAPASRARRPGEPRPVLPTRAQALLAFTHHQQSVRALSWSPDGKSLASGADDRYLLVWRGSDGAIQTSLFQGGSVRAAAWSPDGRQLAIGAANQVKFLDPFAGTTFARFRLLTTTAVTCLAWSPRQPAQVVTGAVDTHAIVWDASAYRAQTVFTRHTAAIEAATWAADGQTIATSSFGGVVRVWNALSGIELHGLYLDSQAPKRALAFAPSADELAAGGDDGLIRLWRHGSTCLLHAQGTFGTQCQDMPRALRGHSGPVRTLSWAPAGGLLASGGDDGLLAIWSPAHRDAPLFTIPHQAPVIASAWSPDGRRLATAAANTVRIWQII